MVVRQFIPPVQRATLPAVPLLTSVSQSPENECAPRADEEKSGHDLIHEHPAHENVRIFAKWLKPKAAKAIPREHAEGVAARLVTTGPEPDQDDATDEPPCHFHELHRDAPLPHA